MPIEDRHYLITEPQSRLLRLVFPYTARRARSEVAKKTSAGHQGSFQTTYQPIFFLNISHPLSFSFSIGGWKGQCLKAPKNINNRFYELISPTLRAYWE
jgi:hypothetical protein